MSDLPSSLRKITPKEQIYVQSRLAGMSQVASAVAAGYSNPKKHASEIEKRPHVQAAILAACNELAEEVQFGRREAHDMLMNAYHNAATATEQVAAVRELIGLHGIAAPKVIEHDHKVSGKVEFDRIDNDELMKLAGFEHLTLEGEFEVVKDGTDDTEALPDLRD